MKIRLTRPTLAALVSVVLAAVCAIWAWPVRANGPSSGPAVNSLDFPPEFRLVRKAAETQSIRITAEVPRVARIGHPVNLKITILNGRAAPITCDHNGDSEDFVLALFDSENKLVPYTEYGRHNQGDGYTFQSNRPLTIDSGDGFTRKYDLTKFFEISKPGFYRLRIIKTIAGTKGFESAGSELEVDIESIHFDLVE